jgi:hypothetical protein
MWSKRFLWAGVSSGIIAAVVLLFSVLLLFYWTNFLFWSLSDSLAAPPHFAYYSMISPFSVSYLVYPACWYFLIFRTRDYSIAQTLILVSCIYPISSALIGAIMGAWDTFRYGLSQPPHSFDRPISIAIWTIAGFVLFLMPYILIAFPVAYLQRFLLLWLFRAATR